MLTVLVPYSRNVNAFVADMYGTEFCKTSVYYCSQTEHNFETALAVAVAGIVAAVAAALVVVHKHK
jgi:hypothetical protein